MAICAIRTLGTFRIKAADGDIRPPSTQKARALLVFLAMQHGRDIARERIVDIFWSGFAPENARTNLNSALYAIRRSFREAGLNADEYVSANKAVVRWVADTDIDAERLEKLVKCPDPPDSLAVRELYAGEFLEGNYDEWSVTQREHLSSIFETLLSRSLEAVPNIGAARELASRNLYDEKAHSVLIEAELSAGRHLAAAEMARQYRSALAELAEQPSADFEEKYRKLERWEKERKPELRLAFAGRHAEVAEIQRLLSDASMKKGRICIVSGEPGIGKTTLLMRACDLAREAGLGVIEARGIANDPRPLGQWASVFEEVTGLEAATVVPEAAASFVDAVCSGIVAAVGGPSLIVADDAQWMEGDAGDAAMKIATLASTSGHAVIFGVRPEGLRHLEPLAETARAVGMKLKPLSKNDVIDSFRGAGLVTSAEFIEAVFARTAGQPLYMEQLLGALLNEGAIRRERNRWYAKKEIDLARAMPGSLAKMLESRLRSAGERAMAVAGVLAMEPGATIDDLIALLESDEAAVMDGLDDLLALEIITQPPDGPAFAFSHDLLREVALSTIGRIRLVTMHRRFVSALGERAGPDTSYRSAVHLEAAGDLYEAAEALVTATHEALQWQAFATAMERVDKGILLAERLEPGERSHLVLSKLYYARGTIFAHSGQPAAALESIRRYVEYAKRSGDEVMLCRSYLTRCAANCYVDRIRDALVDARAGLDLAHKLGDVNLEAHALCRVAACQVLLGHPNEGEDAARAGLVLGHKSDDHWVAMSARSTLLEIGFTYWRFHGIRELVDELIAASQPMGNKNTASAYLHGAWISFSVDRFDEMESHLSTAEKLFDEAASGKVRDNNVGITTQRLRFEIAYARSLLDDMRGRWQPVLDREPLLTRIADAAGLANMQDISRLATISALLGRNAPQDGEHAMALATRLHPVKRLQSSEGFSDCRELALARCAARLRTSDARDLLAKAFETLEHNARRTPLVADRSFALLAAAARDIGESDLSARAGRRSRQIRDNRAAAAEALWGG